MVHLFWLDTSKFVFHSCDVGYGSKEAVFSTVTRQCRLLIAHSSLHEVSTMALLGEEGVESPPPSSVCPDGAASSDPRARTSPIAFFFLLPRPWDGEEGTL